MRAGCTPATSVRCSSISPPPVRSRWTSRTRSPLAPASRVRPTPSPRRRRKRHDRHRPRRRAHRARARHLPRLRGDREGADDAAHAAHVGHELHPRDRHRRGDHRARLCRRRLHEGDRVRRDGAGVRECRRRLVRHRSDARDVQATPRGAEVISDPDVVGLLYLVAIVCFILALRFLSSPKHARKGNWVGGAGMVVAIATTLALDGISNWGLIVAGGLIGSIVGVVGARTVKMTAMPQMVALFNGVGGGAAALVALAEFHKLTPVPGRIHGDVSLSILLSALIGSISFSGSLVAFAKLQELIQGRPIVYPGQKLVNAAVMSACLALGAAILL